MTKRMNMPERKEEHGVASWEDILYTSFSDIERRIPRNTPDTTQQLAIIGIDYADVNDFASCGVLTKAGDTYVWRQHTWISSHSPYLKGIKFPLANAGQPGFEDFEVVDTPTIPINAIVDYCLELMTQYFVVKITMDTYRYHLFQEVFQQAGISIESKQTPNGVVRLVRKIGSACGIVAPDIERQFVLHNIDFGQSAIMRWYTNNTAMQQDKFGNYMYIKINPERRKTDGFMAFVVAYFAGNLLKEQVVYV
jgi:phage terminase large subunit-like protein